MDDLSSPITIHTKVDGHTWISELAQTEVVMLGAALALVNSQMHGRMDQAINCIRKIDAFPHDDWHTFLDKMLNVLQPISDATKNDNPTPGDEWKNTA